MNNLNNKIKEYLNKKNRFFKSLIIIIMDIFFCFVSVILSFYLRLGDIHYETFNLSIVFVLSIVLLVTIFKYSGLYNIIVRYSQIALDTAVLKGMIFYSVIFFSIIFLYGIDNVPRTIGIIQPIVLLFFLLSYRYFVLIILEQLVKNSNEVRETDQKILIYGFNDQGRKFVSMFGDTSNYKIEGFIDNDRNLRNYSARGIKIYHFDDLKNLLIKKKISLILLAFSEYNRNKKNNIIERLLEFNIKVQSIPDLAEFKNKKLKIDNTTELEIEDILGREEVVIEDNLPSNYLNQAVILVTGAGGSIGSKICEELINFKPSILVLLDNSELALYNIHKTLSSIKNTGTKIVPILGSIQDETKIEIIFSVWKPSVIFHAAAYKHVPIVEHNIIEGLNNNIFGTLNIVKKSIKYNVKKFVLISTDKAVRPTNIMGTSKRVAEMILQAYSVKNTQTIFSMVRFGNVLGSSGSVVPLFWNQILKGGPITITHKNITRFFMTNTEAVKLVIQASAISTGGDVFVLDMGVPIKIRDLAVKMVKLSGKTIKDKNNPYGDIEIKVIGLRPGEKLYEEVLLGNNPTKTRNPRIMRASEKYLPLKDLDNKLTKLKISLKSNNVSLLKKNLKKIVPEYKPSKQDVDWVSLNN